MTLISVLTVASTSSRIRTFVRFIETSTDVDNDLLLLSTMPVAVLGRGYVSAVFQVNQRIGAGNLVFLMEKYECLFRCGGCGELIVNGIVSVDLVATISPQSRESLLRRALRDYTQHERGPRFHECAGGPEDVPGLWKLGVAQFAGFRKVA